MNEVTISNSSELRTNRINPSNEIDVSFSSYLHKRKKLTESHLVGGIPDYAYNSDYILRQKIHAIPGVFKFFKALESFFIPRKIQELNMSALKVGPSQFPDVYEMTVDCARILGIAIPTVFILPKQELNAITYPLDDNAPLIVIYTSLLERLKPGELKAVIGHECGHIQNNHVIYNQAVDFLIRNTLGRKVESLADNTIPGMGNLGSILDLIILPLNYALMAWGRAAEVTSDRAGMICCDDPMDEVSSHAKCLSGAVLNRDDYNIDAILKQYDTLSSSPIHFNEILYSHPQATRRILASKAFMDSEILYSWRPEWRVPGKRLLGKQELDARCERFISVAKSEKRGQN
ncbi:MAG: M48 family metallopeptidase [Treponema sp.]|nr:M48 family metallopeptidase [Treponema sp.]